MRTNDPDNLISIFHHLEFKGDVHQASILSIFQALHATPQGFHESAEEFNQYDSRFQAGFWGLRDGAHFTEENDLSNPADINVVFDGEMLVPMGIGDLYLPLGAIQALESHFRANADSPVRMNLATGRGAPLPHVG